MDRNNSSRFPPSAAAQERAEERHSISNRLVTHFLLLVVVVPEVLPVEDSIRHQQHLLTRGVPAEEEQEGVVLVQQVTAATTLVLLHLPLPLVKPVLTVASIQPKRGARHSGWSVMIAAVAVSVAAAFAALVGEVDEEYLVDPRPRRSTQQFLARQPEEGEERPSDSQNRLPLPVEPVARAREKGDRPALEEDGEERPLDRHKRARRSGSVDILLLVILVVLALQEEERQASVLLPLAVQPVALVLLRGRLPFPLTLLRCRLFRLGRKQVPVEFLHSKHLEKEVVVVEVEDYQALVVLLRVVGSAGQEDEEERGEEISFRGIPLYSSSKNSKPLRRLSLHLVLL